MLQRAAGRKKCSSAEQIVRKSVGSVIFSLLILQDQKFEVDKKQSLLTHQQELFTFPNCATQQSEVQFDMGIPKLFATPLCHFLRGRKIASLCLEAAGHNTKL